MQKKKMTTKAKGPMQKKARIKELELRKGLNNSQKEDSSGKLIFEDPILCSQFLRGYIKIPLLKDVQPEDIEDVTERYVHMFTEERNSDVVKKVKLKNSNVPFYLISLIEHKSKVDYNVVMQVLRYMVFIWEDYEKEQERIQAGITKTKGFQYPPILPIIYYTGADEWTAAVKLEERVYLSDILEEYIPDFRCILVQVKDYDNTQLMEKHDELSIIMMINRMQESADFTKWKEEVDLSYLNDTTKKTPQYLLGIMAQVMKFLLLNINVPEDEAEDVAGMLKERKMAGLFDHFEKYDVQATRAKARAEGRTEGRKEARAEERENGIRNMINLAIDFGSTKEGICEQLMKYYELSAEEALKKVELYWELHEAENNSVVENE